MAAGVERRRIGKAQLKAFYRQLALEVMAGMHPVQTLVLPSPLLVPRAPQQECRTADAKPPALAEGPIFGL